MPVSKHLRSEVLHIYGYQLIADGQVIEGELNGATGGVPQSWEAGDARTGVYGVLPPDARTAALRPVYTIVDSNGRARYEPYEKEDIVFDLSKPATASATDG